VAAVGFDRTFSECRQGGGAAILSSSPGFRWHLKRAERNVLRKASSPHRAASGLSLPGTPRDAQRVPSTGVEPRSILPPPRGTLTQGPCAKAALARRADVYVYQDHRSIGFLPTSPRAREWFARNADSEPGQWLGRVLWVDHRIAVPLFDAVVEAGLRVSGH
jgi:hypothetical protein